MSESIWYAGFCSAWYFGSSCFVTAWVFKILFSLYSEAGTRTNCPISREMFNEGRSKCFISCSSFSDTRTYLLCFQVIPFRESNCISFWNFVTQCGFLLCRFALRRFTIHSQKKRMNSFRQDWRKKTFEFAGERLKHLESIEILCVLRPKILNISFRSWFKILRERIRCL